MKIVILHLLFERQKCHQPVVSQYLSILSFSRIFWSNFDSIQAPTTWQLWNTQCTMDQRRSRVCTRLRNSGKNRRRDCGCTSIPIRRYCSLFMRTNKAVRMNNRSLYSAWYLYSFVKREITQFHIRSFNFRIFKKLFYFRRHELNIVCTISWRHEGFTKAQFEASWGLWEWAIFLLFLHFWFGHT